MTRRELLKTTELFLLDLDGTVYLGEEPIGAMRETLSSLRGMGKRLVFLTNNSSRTEEEYREKLKRIGLWGEGDDVFTSGSAAIGYFHEHLPNARVFLLATDSVKESFRREGICLNEEDPDVCLVAYDTELTFEKMRRFDAFLRNGVRFFATHPDDVCPAPDGSAPDVGSFLALFERSSGRRPELIFGKPFSEMGKGLERRYGVPREKMCMAGDRMHTDIRFANANGMRSILVLSGETTEESRKHFPDVPDLILPDLNHIFDED